MQHLIGVKFNSENWRSFEQVTKLSTLYSGRRILNRYWRFTNTDSQMYILKDRKWFHWVYVIIQQRSTIKLQYIEQVTTLWHPLSKWGKIRLSDVEIELELKYRVKRYRVKIYKNILKEDSSFHIEVVRSKQFSNLVAVIIPATNRKASFG